MPDDRRPGGPDGPPDETAQFRPEFSDETRAAPPPRGDDTVASGPGGDATVVGRPPVDDPTVVRRPAADDTLIGPPLDPAGPGPGPGPVWSGRAEVPPAGVRSPGPQTQRWETVQPVDEPGRWWMPILIGLVGLLLLGLLGYGLWLIAAGQDEPGPATPTATRTVPPARPTTAPPTTREPEPTPDETVEVPSLAGETLPDAQDRLDELDLTYRVRFEETDEQEPGRVIRTEPDAGSRLEPGTRVTLVVAAEPEPTQPPTEAPSATETPDQD